MSTVPGTTWVDLPTGSPYPLANLPYGVFGDRTGDCRLGVRIGDHVLDLRAAEEADLVSAGGTLRATRLNDFLTLGRPQWTAVRRRLTELLADPRHAPAVRPLLVPVSEISMRLPFAVADYVDFYSCREHAENLGRLFRPGSPPLLPNWTHLPVGYHGRAGTVVPSGTPIIRPSGQRRRPGEDTPSFGPTERLDIEAEVGFVVGAPTAPGTAVSSAALADHVFGVVLVNDWSARDIQAWEYQPLGPFLGKSFATSISPWVVPLEALDAARVAPPAQQPPVLPYLRRHEAWGLELRLEVILNGAVISRPPFAGLYWTPDQQLAHLTVNGAALRAGDLFASGTVSGPERDQRGSLIELAWNGAHPIELPDGSTRVFLADGDVVTITGVATGLDGSPIGLGEVTGTIEPAR
ncbi:MAG: fumarylacetoacetase [Actinobacteria bacterium]|nr:fumarylacetoacetase [Actinomycetota bacterium]MBI3688874.1 fumarylacetoacetase [Actinomycetota bacterium]